MGVVDVGGGGAKDDAKNKDVMDLFWAVLWCSVEV